MPLPQRTLTEAHVAQVSAEMFTPSEQECFGIEVEWPLHRPGDVSARPAMHDMHRLEQEILPAGGRVTFEPGGQVELSSAPATSPVDALRAVELDARVLGERLLAAGFVREALAVDLRRAPRRVLDRPRYQAMEHFFATRWDAGTWMMCNTASVQVNISFDPRDPHARWHTLHRIAPVLIAAFANSPGQDFAGRHWVSLRQAIWWSIDPARTRAVRDDLPPEHAWAQYALDADVMLIDAGDGVTAVPPGFPFGRWLTHGHEIGWPTIEDLRYHMSTLFPPVRPRGWLELRVLDALPQPARDIAVLAVAVACMNDASVELRRRLPDTRDLWVAASSDGLTHPTLARAATTFFEIVGDHLGGVSVDPEHAAIMADFVDRSIQSSHAGGGDARMSGLKAPITATNAPALAC